MIFSGKVALVTGAGSPRGIGFAIARLLAQQGAKIAITSTTQRIEDRARELSAEGDDVFALVADLCKHNHTQALVQSVARERPPRCRWSSCPSRIGITVSR